ncbi:MAG: 30S ribosomal protein S1 [Anaerolineae bacterium]
MKGAIRPEARSEHDPMSALLDEYVPPRPCKRGDIVRGVIVCSDPKGFLVDIGGKCDAVVPPREVERMRPDELDRLQPGKTIPVYIVEVDSNSIVVSLAKAAQEKDWMEAQELLESEDPVELEVVDSNKGGLIVHLGRLRGFVPGSQLMPKWRPLQNLDEPHQRWEALVGKVLTLRVIEVTAERNRLILSERKGRKRPDKQAILEQLEVGAVETGMVSNIVDFGAFVNVRGIDGLLHISELSWRRVNHPSEIVHLGQKLRVLILDVDMEKERFNLSLKRLQRDPWDEVEEVYNEGELVEVEIVNLTSFGAFACPVDNPAIEGLIHISELCDHPVDRPDEIVEVGTCRMARIISMRADDRRIAFSLKRVEEELQEIEDREEETDPA